MSDRLVELFRQRAALQQQLADVDRQIAAASGPSPAPSSSTPAAPPRVSIPATILNTDADEIIGQYSNNPRQITTDVRRGCLLYSAVALLILALGVYAFMRFLPHK